MHRTFALVLACLSTALADKHIKQQGSIPVPTLPKRQFQFGTGTCAEAFGAGNIVCQGNTCFNPSAGEDCCANGHYCPDGYYCAEPDTCCPDGSTLEECGATATIATIPGFDDSATSTSILSSAYTLTTAITITSATTWTSTSVSSTAISDSFSETPSPPAYTVSSSSTASSSSTSTASTTVTGNATQSYIPPAQYTGGATAGGEAIGWLLSGFSFLGLGFLL